MKPRSLALLAAATVLAVAAAAYVSTQRTNEPAAVQIGLRLFPDLPTRADQVRRIEIVRGPGTVTLVRDGDAWVAANRGNYPAMAQRVRELIVDMAQITTLEAKTSTPSLYASMEVEDPTGDDPRSGQVRLLDANGAMIAGLIVGRARSGRSAEDDAVFVRRAGEAQSWLVRGRMNLPRDIASWLDRTVVDVERPRVRQVTTTQPDGERLIVQRASREASDFTVADVPEGRRAKPAADVNQVGQAFDRIELDDVRPAADIPFPAAPARAEVETYDGMALRVELTEHEGQTWARFVARAIPPVDSPAPAPPPAPAPAPAAGAPAPATPPAAAPQPRDVGREIADLNARLSRWVYRLPAYRVEAFKRKLEDVLEARSS